MNFAIGQPARSINNTPRQPGPLESLLPFSDRPTSSSTSHARAEGSYKWRTVRWNAVGELPEVVVLSSLIVLLRLIYGTTEDDEFVTYAPISRFTFSLLMLCDNRKPRDENDIVQYLPTLRDWLQALTKIGQVRDAIDDPSVLWRCVVLLARDFLV